MRACLLACLLACMFPRKWIHASTDIHVPDEVENLAHPEATVAEIDATHDDTSLNGSVKPGDESHARRKARQQPPVVVVLVPVII